MNCWKKKTELTPINKILQHYFKLYLQIKLSGISHQTSGGGKFCQDFAAAKIENIFMSIGSFCEQHINESK